MKLTQTGSLWGNLYRLRHYINGVRVSDAAFKQAYQALNLTPELGKVFHKTAAFRIDWIIPNAGPNQQGRSQAGAPA